MGFSGWESPAPQRTCRRL